MRFILGICFVLAGVAARADFNLAFEDADVVCKLNAHESWTINQLRTEITHVTHGQSKTFPILDASDTDEDTYQNFKIEDGVLSFNDQGDTFQFEGDEAQPVDCTVKR